MTYLSPEQYLDKKVVFFISQTAHAFLMLEDIH